MYLAILDYSGADETERILKVGWVMVFTNIFLIYFFIGVFALNLVWSFFQGMNLLIKYCMQRRQRNSTSFSSKVYPENFNLKDDNSSNIRLEPVNEQQQNEVDSTEKNSEGGKDTSNNDGAEDDVYKFTWKTQEVDSYSLICSVRGLSSISIFFFANF